MKIGLHTNQLDHRGNSTVILDYARAIRDIIGHEPIIISSGARSIQSERFSEFRCHLYDDSNDIPNIVNREKIDVLYMTKAGNVDSMTPTNCKTAIHCVFDMREPHGTVYAGVSEWLAKHFNMPLWVPHIIDVPKTTKTLHDELGISKDAFIIGRLGGYDQFDVSFVRTAIEKALDLRSNLWAIFLNTKPFTDHPRTRFLPFRPEIESKSEFINTCDAMIHGRSDGETFGLAVAEFSAMNKPILTYDAPYWWYMRAHIDMLGEKALLYKNEEELLSYLLQIDKEYVKDVDWDCYSTKFSPTNVIDRFNKIFIK